MNIRFVLILLLFIGCKDIKKSSVNKEFPAWNIFLEKVSSKNKQQFKEISNSKIRCYLCLENTASERKKLDNFRDTDSLWHKKLYDDLIYIPIDSFLQNDFDLFFTKQFVEVLKKGKTVFSKVKRDGFEYCEVLVTTTEPTASFEGGQHAFQFKKIEGIWKFNGISTIP